MDPSIPYRLVLYYASSLTGLITIIGGVWLLSKQKIYLDTNTKAIVSFEVPFFGKLRTNVPSLGLFIIGLFLLILPLEFMKSLPGSGLPSLQIRGAVNSNGHPVVIYAVIRSQAVWHDGAFSISMPERIDPTYDPKVLYVTSTAQGIVDDEIELGQQRDGVISLLPKNLQLSDTTVQTFVPNGSNQPPSDFRH